MAPHALPPAAPNRRADLERRLAEAASRQHGVVTRAQLLAAGLTADAIDARVRSRRLLPLHRGVYLHGALVGPLEPARSREMAAALACGRGALVSHASAASLWGLLPAPPAGQAGQAGRARPVHVTVPGGDRGRRPGIRPHRVARIPPCDAARLVGIPVTAPARTLVDLAGGVGSRALEQAMAEAERRGLAELDDVAAALERAGRVRGTSRLRRLIEAGTRPAYTRSAAEERFLGLVRGGRLSPPETNVHLAGVEVDFYWRAERVVVEVDGFAYHGSRGAYERDRRRDARLVAEGFRVVRVTWRQLVDEPNAVLVRLAQLLALAGATP